jgi:hypothetical protein
MSPRSGEFYNDVRQTSYETSSLYYFFYFALLWLKNLNFGIYGVLYYYMTGGNLDLYHFDFETNEIRNWKIDSSQYLSC